MRRRPRWWPGVLAWALWALTVLGIAGIAWLQHLLRQAGRPDLAGPDASAVPYALAMVSAATVGAVLASSSQPTPWAGCCWPWGCRWVRPR
jgi:hypothetical protein